MNLLKFLKVLSQANNTKVQKRQSTLQSTTHLSWIEHESTSEEEDSFVIKQDNQLQSEELDLEVTTKHENSSSSFVCMTSAYNENSGPQSSASTLLICPLLSKAVKNITTDNSSDFVNGKESDATKKKVAPLTISEYGCATGGSSLAPLHAICKQIDNDGKKIEINVIMNDLPLNDWDVLSETLDPIKHCFKNLEFKKSSMYDEGVVTKNTLHIGYSCFAQHWLSVGSPTTFPADGSSSIWPQQLPTSFIETKNSWAEAAMNDWATFLDRRFDELVYGGHLVIVIQASRNDGTLSENFANTLMKVKEGMILDNTLSRYEASKMTMPEYPKTEKEILAPFESEPNSSRWDIEEMVFTELECPILKQWKAMSTTAATTTTNNTRRTTSTSGDGDGDASVVVKKQIGFCRSFMDSSLTSCVGKDKGEMFWERVATFVGNDTEALAGNFSVVSLMLRKKK